MQILPALLLNIPEAVQISIAENLDNESKRALAVSTYLTSNVADILVTDKDHTTSYLAMRKTTNEKLLKKYANGNSRKTEAVAANLNTPADILEQCLTSISKSVKIHAYTNPNTPESSRKKHLTPQQGAEITEHKGILGMSVAKAYSLFENNQWIAENVNQWPLVIQRAVSGSPRITAETVAFIKQNKYHRWYSFTENPAFNGEDITLITTDNLVLLGGSASDLEALSREDFTQKHADIILQSERQDAEPNVIAKIVNILGANSLQNGKMIADTRVKSAAWVTPAVKYYKHVHNTGQNHDWELTLNILEENITAWEAFFKLAPNWESTSEKLAHVALNL